MKIGLWIVAASMLLVVLEALASYHLSQNFWPKQVVAKWGNGVIAFATHGGMWGDLLLLPTLFAFIITRYGDVWTTKQVTTMAIVGVAVTLANHILLIKTQYIPDPIGWKKEKWSTVIALHFVYMSTYVALAGLFFCYSEVSVRASITVSVVLGIHMTFGTHVLLGVLNRLRPLDWCPDFLGNDGLMWVQFGIWTILSIFAWVAAGLEAAFYTAWVGIALITALLVFIFVTPQREQ